MKQKEVCPGFCYPHRATKCALHMNDWSYGCIAKLLASSIADLASRSTLISRH